MDLIKVVAGVKVPVFEKESFVAEIAFIDGVRLGIGLEMKLK